MDPTEHSPKEIVSSPSVRFAQLNSQKLSKSEVVANPEPSGPQKISHHAPRDKQATVPPPSFTSHTQSNQGNYGRVPDGREESIQTPGVVTGAQIGNQETCSRAPQRRQTTIPPPSTTTRAQSRHQESPYYESQELRRTLSTSARETHHNAPTSARAQHSMEQYTNMEQHYTNIDSQNKELRNQIKKNQAVLTSLQAKLAESEARGAGLQTRLEEASNTIFRLRPQRQEYTESEIEEDYRKMTKAVKNWINVNCEAFVDDDLRGFDSIGSSKVGPAAHPETFEAIMFQFQSESSRWIEAKEHVLVAVVMRYLFDRILNQSFSVLLRSGERDFLATIQNSMENMELQKDLLTIRTWKSDTVTAIDSHDNFMNRYSSIKQMLTNDLHNILRRTLSSQNNESTVLSLSKDIIVPAISLAQKTQSASSIWTFKYSEYSKYLPGEFGSSLPNFLTNVQDFRCINMSNRDKVLKPASDLTSKEQQENLLYVLDIFPGLYCQRVTAGDSPPLSTISQPVLLVEFAANDTYTCKQREPSEPADPGRANQNRKPSPVRPDSKAREIAQKAGRFIGIGW